MTTATQENHQFQAEVKKVLDIVIHSLYTDKEIFLRELVSNASDALEKLRHTQLTEKSIYDDSLGLEIHISFDEAAGTITLQDYGIGMTREELIENLGTIAHSGSKKFLEALKNSGKTNENLIGQFGVGFYSAFMVADSVDVYTHSWKADAKGWHWSSNGSNYTIEEAEGLNRGTKIVLKLKEDAKEFASEYRIKTILTEYSSFVPFPIFLNDKKLDTVQALWLRGKSELKDEEYKEFYKFQAKAFDDPLFWLHFNADAPLTINALLYVPKENTEKLGFNRTECGVSLYCRKVLIDSEPKGLLPEWLRFLRGVIDSADLPLNISRESMQDSQLLQKLNRVVTKKFLKHLEDLAKKAPEEYNTFWKTFGIFLKEGVTSDFAHKEQLGKLLRFESSATEKGKTISLEEYASRTAFGQNEIYYLVGPSREAIEQGPYYEAFKANGLEVLFCYEPIDDFVMSHLGEFDSKKLVSGDSESVELKSTNEPSDSGLPESETQELCNWFKTIIGEEKLEEVAPSKRLSNSPAFILTDSNAMNAQMRRIMKAMNQDMPEPKVKLQINPSHNLIKKLDSLRKNNESLAKLVAEQVFDNARLAAGLLEDATDFSARMTKIMEEL